jgi:hypothetical protein
MRTLQAVAHYRAEEPRRMQDASRTSSRDPQQSTIDIARPADADLPDTAQRWNSFVFLISYSISYFVAPVFYVGVVHAAIIHSYRFSDTVANLPETVFLWMLPLPILITWFWPSTRFLRPILATSFLLKGLAGILVAVLFLVAPRLLLVGGLVVHAAIIGGMNGVSNMCLWELIGRGTAPARRSWTLALSFGIGPIFAVLGSCVSQLVLNGNFVDLIRMRPIPAPWSYVLLFGATGPAMIVACVCVRLAHVPTSSKEEPRASVAGIFSGLREYFTHRLIVIAAMGFLLTSAGDNMIMPNLALYVRDAMGQLPEKFSGLQLMIRFGVKSLFGFALGALLAKTYPKLPAMATTLLSLAGVIWALLVPGKWYMLSFGLLGAGELYYIYYLNYIVGCSAPQRIRENIAYTNVIPVAISWVPLVYGWISDHHGLKASFKLAAGILVATTLIVGLLLPRRPSPGARSIL